MTMKNMKRQVEQINSWEILINFFFVTNLAHKINFSKHWTDFSVLAVLRFMSVNRTPAYRQKTHEAKGEKFGPRRH